MKTPEPYKPIDLAASRREKRLRTQLLALLFEPETQLLMRADNVDANELLKLLLRTADGLAVQKAPHPTRSYPSQRHVKCCALSLLKILVDLKRRFDKSLG
ncbi:MAG: hypothetical protein QM780_10145 [Hyphomicrobium sp.]|uniref:hypothetical protein n=1 Tax=Hyphomicrobium sp. TaxID=82 RepID=UPI0039E27935